ncbi:hypothetical protein N6L24_03315 [Cognatishimia sp. SS12]|nr:hypothetical protein [Cognatishimia sp. SS12]MDC0737294.1 hypothetical protein [Cognatishimia sp. SS12]
MPVSMQQDPKQSANSTRQSPPEKQIAGKPGPKKPIFSDWAMI